MKKLLLIVALLLLPLLAVAQENETLLTSDGKLYMIRPVTAEETPDVDNKAAQYLVLSTRRGADAPVEAIVPASTSKGTHRNAAMAYDTESKTLFVFWLHDTHASSGQSRLVFASVDDSGVWSEPTEFGEIFNVRENLRIGVTRRVLDVEQLKLTAGLTVHATWWEFDSQKGEYSARYAVMAIENGRVAELDLFDLSTLVSGPTAEVTDPENPALKNPLMFPSPNHDSMYVVFGDVATNQLTLGRVFPTKPPKADGRLRVPVGRREGGFTAPGFSLVANSRMGGIYGDVDRLALYAREGDALKYVVLRDGVWGESRSIALDAQISAPAAIEAIRKLLND